MEPQAYAARARGTEWRRTEGAAPQPDAPAAGCLVLLALLGHAAATTITITTTTTTITTITITITITTTKSDISTFYDDLFGKFKIKSAPQVKL